MLVISPKGDWVYKQKKGAISPQKAGAFSNFQGKRELVGKSGSSGNRG